MADGKIITFYSYKGGTGRSMALANTAWILASNGRRVLAIDWDLEAPGLHEYFHPFLLDPELTSTDGVIDFVIEYANAALAPDAPDDPNWQAPFDDLAQLAVSLERSALPDGATLDFIPAGRQGLAYATRVNSFDWRAFYERLGGRAVLQRIRRRLKAEYDYVLVDSRTGVSDTSGICTVSLPDRLAVCFTLNAQSVRGASAVTRSILELRASERLDVYPIPMRIELAEDDRLNTARDDARRRFDFCLDHVEPAKRPVYWGDVEVLYKPLYAYEEVLAPFMEGPEERNSVLAALERVTAHLTHGDVVAVAALDDDERRRLRARYDRASDGDGPPKPVTPLRPGTYVGIAGASENRDFMVRLAAALKAEIPPVLAESVDERLAVDADWEEAVEEALRGATSLLLVVGAGPIARSVDVAWRRAIRYDKPVIPLLIERDATVPLSLEGEPAFDFTGDFATAVARLGEHLRWLGSRGAELERLRGQLAQAHQQLAASPTAADRARAQVQIAEIEAQIAAFDRHEDGSGSSVDLVVSEDHDVVAAFTGGASIRGSIELDGALTITANVVTKALDGGVDIDRDDFEGMGALLFGALFPGTIGARVEREIEAAAESSAPLHVRLSFENSPKAARLPWEYVLRPATALRPGAFLATAPGIVLSRRVAVTRQPRTVESNHPPRLLWLETPGSDRIPLPGPPEHTRVEVQDVRQLLAAVKATDPDIVHVALHARGGPTSAIEFAIGGPEIPRWISPTMLIDCLHEARRLSLAVVESPVVASMNIGATMLQAGIPAVVVLPGAKSDEAHEFLTTFYESVFDGMPIDEAVQSARRRSALIGDWPDRTWAQPTLYVASPPSLIDDPAR